MRWPVFIIIAFAALVMDESLGHVLRLWTIAPTFAGVVVVYIALFAPRRTALWAAWTIGLIIDLWTDLPYAPERVGPLFGAHALGYVFGAYLVLQLRTMVFRRRSLTLGVLTVLCVIAQSLVVVFIYTVHGWYPAEAVHWAELQPAAELLRHLASAVYSGLLALLIGPLLLSTGSLWGFRLPPPRHAGRR